MNKEFMERYRTAIFMALSVIMTAFVLFLAYAKNDIKYLDRAIYFFSGMCVFFVFRNTIKSIKLNNKQIGLQIDASQQAEQKPPETEVKK